jgi:predicted amidohydrolase
MRALTQSLGAVVLLLATSGVLQEVAAAVPDASKKKTLRVAVVQTVIEGSLDANRKRIIGFIRKAKEAGCQLAVFPEDALFWPDITDEKPTKARLDRAIGQIRTAARDAGVCVVFGSAYKTADSRPFQNRAYALGPDGRTLNAYWKNTEVPHPFDVAGVRCQFTICSDRGYLEHSDLACLVDGAKIIIDISGGHGGDDGRPSFRWIRYRPWAVRTGAWVIVSNPVHADTDFMGHSPWGGGSAVVRPDGSLAARLLYQKNQMIVVDVDPSQATRREAERRRRHPSFKKFWDLGERLLAGKRIDPVPPITPYRSARRDVKIAAAQITCSGKVGQNTAKILDYMRRAAREGADVVVFPELALTGNRPADVLAAKQADLDAAVNRIREAARTNHIYAIVGLPYVLDGARRDCAFVIGDDGKILTRYAQIATPAGKLFQPGRSTKAMWFKLKGVYAIVTVGNDADWIEIGDLAAARGMCLRFHISNAAGASADEAVLRKQRDLLALSYAQFGAAVNAGGGSLIASREGGHNKPAPKGLEHYLPYQTSVVHSAGKQETILYATRRTSAFNKQDLNRYWRNRTRKRRADAGWYEWINAGARMIEAEAASGMKDER